MKKILATLLALTLILGCVSAFAAESIEVETTYTDTNLAVLTEIAEAFTAETGIEVEIIAPGSE